ncbi:hypothetical protein HII13_003690 [Brettanomyces bruxellensis]|uniref:Uncharacterized protein n=1 Tax=Dekkera bruxellensis TaxID=5007 RepID=A0A8H6BPW7_DEKBR|nr:hypothetical protein HII13_003690 [Brettanomyces bruxellensis]KAF6015770.1 hypothetical protein HII12_000562 [Brettanomyces bruxellensis]
MQLKYDNSFKDITKYMNDHETENTRLIDEIKEDLLVQEASVENGHARTLKEIDEQLDRRLDDRVRIFENPIKDNTKEITTLNSKENSRENNYKLLNEDTKKVNIAVNLIKNKLEKQGEKLLSCNNRINIC